MRDTLGAMTAFSDDPMMPRLTEQTDHLLRTIGDLDDAAALAPSLLPGWSRGHVLTHVAHNADALARVLRVAITGDVVAMYPSAESRDREIEAGARQGAGALRADVASSAERLIAALAAARADGLDRMVPTGRGGEVRVRLVPTMRVREVVYHHVDLDHGFGFEDVPEELVRAGLENCVRNLARAPLTRFVATFGAGPDLDLTLGTGARPDGAQPGGTQPEEARTVRGTGPSLLAWLTGRSPGSAVTADDGTTLPILPAWG